VKIDFLTEKDVLQIHQDQINLYGGASGLIDLGSLKSSIAQPQATFGGTYLHQDVFHMAAAYLFHICENHSFVDGNKRAAAVSSLVFLDFNGYELTASETDFENLVWDVARKTIGKDQVRIFLKKHAKLK